MALSLQVIYPVAEDTQFDMDYYLGTHLPMVAEHWGPHLNTTLVTKGVAGGPDTPPAYYAVATLTFADQDAMDAAMAKAEPLLADIPKFTNTQPQMLIGEVIS